MKKVHFKAGDVAPTGSVLMDIEQEGDGPTDEAATDEPAAAPSVTVPEVETSAGPGPTSLSGPDGKPLATPAVRRVAREHGVQLADVSGTGKAGRILKSDVLAFIQSGGAPSQPQPAAAAAPAPAATSAAPAAPQAGGPEVPLHAAPVPGSSAAPDQEVPVRGLQRAMVRSMDAAWAVPHFGYSDEVGLDALSQLRAEMKPLAADRSIKLSYLPFILKATSLALKQHPSLNAWAAADGSSVTIKGAHHIGVAMDTPRGLIVPNVKDCQDRSVLSIAEELGRLQVLAAAGKLGEEDLKGGTFSLSNIGAIGGTYASPVLVVPQVAIGALGRMQKVPRVMPRTRAQRLGLQVAGLGSPFGAVDGAAVGQGSEDVMAACHVMRVSWSADHRVVDGATMARFSNLWASYLENPTTMIADLR